jgi:thioredoxin-related protein
MKNNKTLYFFVFIIFFSLSACAKDIVAPKGWQLPDVKDFQDTLRNEDQDKYIFIIKYFKEVK